MPFSKLRLTRTATPKGNTGFIFLTGPMSPIRPASAAGAGVLTVRCGADNGNAEGHFRLSSVGLNDNRLRQRDPDQQITSESVSVGPIPHMEVFEATPL